MPLETENSGEFSFPWPCSEQRSDLPPDPMDTGNTPLQKLPGKEETEKLQFITRLWNSSVSPLSHVVNDTE